VAMFSALVIAILLFAEWDAMQLVGQINLGLKESVINTILFYSAFAFFISLIREIIKDLEDQDSDQKMGIRTIGTSMSKEQAKIIVAFNIGFLLIIIGIWFYSINIINNTLLAFLGLSLLILPCLFLFYKNIKSVSTSDFHSASKLSKLIMIFGLLFLICLKWI
jgi:4-hydroxybenzoate polyprenyltransferase